MIRALLPMLLLGLLASCSDSIVSECDAPVDPGLRVQARLSDIQAKVFTPSCATAGCHAGSTPQANLNLSAGSSYAQLVGAGSLNFPGEVRVQAGSSQQSVLMSLLRRERGPAMPPAGSLEPAVLDSIALWIDTGAENN